MRFDFLCLLLYTDKVFYIRKKGVSSLQNRLDDNEQQELIDSSAKLFAEEVAPELGYRGLDFSMGSLSMADSCLERVAATINQLPIQKRAAKQRAMVTAASAYIAKTLVDNRQLQPVKDASGQLVMLTPEKSGWQVAVDIARMVEKKLEDPSNDSIVARFMIGLFLGEMFGGSNHSG